MKNIFVLPTDKPSRLVRFFTNKYHLCKEILPIQDEEKYVNIYITSDEEIKEGDYVYSTSQDYNIQKVSKGLVKAYQEVEHYKKIILTTDSELIKDGVQPIDDEFLEWFVKNPSCEFVEIEDWLDDNGNIAFDGNTRYQIIIAKEEPKQETLEEKLDKIVSKKPSKFWEESDKRFKYKEALEEASEYYAHNYFEMHETNSYKELKRGFTAGAKWQAKRMYSEEEVEHIFNIGQMTKNYGDYKPYTFKEAMEQFKKK